jgi:predicted Zn finger-like uncharacterized protein
MWCPNCKADVAAEVGADNRRVRCATCGGEISASAAFTGLAKTREARDLLERWASERKVDSPPPSRSERRVPRATGLADESAIGGVSLEAEPPAPAPSRTERSLPASTAAQAEPARPAPNRPYRIDPSQPLAGPAGHAQRTAHRHRSAHLHWEHENSDASPHFGIQGSLIGSERKKTNWTSVVGQLVAYAGVALLTVGTTLIIWSYFGGPANYAPTGWLTTTAGQMLLFLGVVTLVSGGMEQTSEEVRTRIERLGERIIRIEQIAREQALRGPNLPVEYYDQPGPPPGSVEAMRDTVPFRQQ